MTAKPVASSDIQSESRLGRLFGNLMRLLVSLSLITLASCTAETKPPQMEVWTTPPGEAFVAPPRPDYYRIPNSVDPETLDQVNAEGQHFFNPGTLGMLALPEGYANYEERRTHFDDNCNQAAPLSDRQQLAIRRLEETATPVGNGGITWLYDFPMLGADYIIAPPYPSAFSQAVNIHALLFAYCKTDDPSYLELATKGGIGMMVPISRGGVLNDADGLVWYEELVAPPGYAPYIFNGHAYAILALYMLGEATGDQRFTSAAQQGVASMNRLLSLYDTGYWTKYDLRPPSPLIYIEAHFSDGTQVQRLSAATPAGDAFTLCASGCTATLSSAQAGNSFRFNVNLASLREFHAQDIEVRLSADASGPVQFYTLSRRPMGGNEVFLLPDDVMQIDDMGWGQTQEAYQLWHALLMEEIAKWTNDPLHRETAERWRSYIDQAQRDRAEGIRERVLPPDH